MRDPLDLIHGMLRLGRLGRLATVAADGQPAIRPCRYAYDPKWLILEPPDDSVLADIAQEPRVSFLVDFGVAYADLRGVVVFGRATGLPRDEIPDELRDVLETYDRKYADLEDERMGVGLLLRPRTYLLLRPERARWYIVGGFLQGSVDWPPHGTTPTQPGQARDENSGTINAS